MKYIPYLLFSLSMLFFSCFINPINNSDNIKGLYSIQNNGLYYSDIDSIGFEQISEINGILNLHYIKHRDLLIASSRDKLYFINTTTNEIISEIDIPRTSGLDGDIASSYVYMFSHPTNDDYCILCNCSIFQINLNTFSIEEVLWNILEVEEAEEAKTGNEYSLYMHSVAQSPDQNNLYLQFTIQGTFPIGNDLEIRRAIKNHLMSYDILQDSMYSIIDYPLENNGFAGSKYIYCNDENVLPYDPNTNSIIRIPTSDLFDTSLRDTVIFNNDLVFFNDSYSGINFSYVQYPYSGSFYKIKSSGAVNRYMELDYSRSEFAYEDTIVYGPAIYGTTYQKLEGGDVYACVPFTTDTTAVLVNLSRKTIIKEFKSDFFQTILIVEK
ncbi:MAG: hypothetical protein U9Q91_00060 [Candidatus Marinimicrobia bacterium]|nr:hypothetical protein [Candidatus Neomarinimicrobiota bacterium]